MTELKKYETRKTVYARPMTLGEYNEYRGWEIPEDEDPSYEGYLVVYHIRTEHEYESWCPKWAFEESATKIKRHADD